MLRQTVAIISDSEKIAGAIREMVNSRLFDVEIFRDSRSFLSVFEKYRLDVAVTGLQNSNSTAELQLIRQIRKTDENIRVIVIANQPSQKLERRVRSQGIAYFAIWPEDRYYLKEVINAALVSRYRERYNHRRSLFYPINQRVFA
ncbi:MAG TPA: response regulator [Bacteroidetes bacterium]|nr:response regulator [Bacteroidota bacterium]